VKNIASLDLSSFPGEGIRFSSEIMCLRTRFFFPEQALSEKWEKGFRKLKEKEQIGFLAIGEFRCFTQSNADFRPEYLNLPILKTRLAVATSLFTATPTNDVRTAALATFGIEHRLAQEDLNRGEIFLDVHLAGNTSNLGNVDYFFPLFSFPTCSMQTWKNIVELMKVEKKALW